MKVMNHRKSGWLSFHSTVLNILTHQVTHGAAETEDVRKRLEAAEAELKLMLEGSRGQEEVEALTEGSGRSKEVKSAPIRGGQGENTQSRRSGRKSRRGAEFILSICCYLKCQVR